SIQELESPFALKCGLRVIFRASGSKNQGSRFNGRPSVSKTESGGSNPSSPASIWGQRNWRVVRREGEHRRTDGRCSTDKPGRGKPSRKRVFADGARAEAGWLSQTPAKFSARCTRGNEASE